MSSALEFTNVSKTYRTNKKNVQALKNISFSLNSNEVFGFVGPNGAGKSTAIKIMLGIINDYIGDVRLYGLSARDALSRRGIAYVPEAPALYDTFTPLETLRTALSMYGIRRPDADAWCMSWLERFSVAPVAKRRIRELSKGTVQRVALAHAMVVSPHLLVLDEPLSGLDPVGRKDVVEILNEYKSGGGTIFFTSHVLYDVERIADRFGFINKGELVTVRSPRDLIAERANSFIVRYQATTPLTSACRPIRDNEFECETKQHQLADLVSRLDNIKGHLQSISPAASLEAVFFSALEKESTE